MVGLPFIVAESLKALGAVVGIGGLLALAEGLRGQGMGTRSTRRIVHIGVCLGVAASPCLFARPLPVYVLAAVFAILNAVAWSCDWWAGLHAARPDSWGTLTLAVSVLVALGMTWSIAPDRLFAFHEAYLVLAVAEPAASWIGERACDQCGLASEATVSGSLTFAGLTLGLSMLVLVPGTLLPPKTVLGAAIGATLIAVAVEAISRRGWDNLFIPLALIVVWIALLGGACDGRTSPRRARGGGRVR